VRVAQLLEEQVMVATRGAKADVISMRARFEVLDWVFAACLKNWRALSTARAAE